MRDVKIGRWSALRFVAGAAVLLALAGCGDDDEGGPSDDPFRAGTWNFTVTSTTSGPGDCPSGPETGSFQLPLCAGDEPVGEGCDGDYSGSTVAFDCTQTMQVGDCSVTTRTVASGTFTETSFDITAQITETMSQGEGCVADPCTQSLHVIGAWLASSGSCKGETIGVGSMLHRTIAKAVPGLRIQSE